MRVIQVAPACFGMDGLFGGGERYPLELARALAREADNARQLTLERFTWQACAQRCLAAYPSAGAR